MSGGISNTFNKLNASRTNLEGLRAKFDHLPNTARVALEQALRVGVVSRDDMKEARGLIQNAQAALDRFFIEMGARPQTTHPLVDLLIGTDLFRSVDDQQPDKIAAKLQQLAEAHANLAQHPTWANVETVIELHDALKMPLAATSQLRIRTGDTDAIAKTATDVAARLGAHADVLSAASDLALRLSRAEFATGLGGKMGVRRDDLIWSTRLIGATALLLSAFNFI